MNITLSILVLFGLFNMISCWWQASPTCPELKPMDNFDLNTDVKKIPNSQLFPIPNSYLGTVGNTWEHLGTVGNRKSNITYLVYCRSSWELGILGNSWEHQK